MNNNDIHYLEHYNGNNYSQAVLIEGFIDTKFLGNNYQIKYVILFTILIIILLTIRIYFLYRYKNKIF